MGTKGIQSLWDMRAINPFHIGRLLSLEGVDALGMRRLC